MATLLTPPVLYFTDNDGNPLSMGKIYTYQAGTLTKKATFQDAAQVTPHQNPVILDAFGRTVMYGGGSYRMMIKDKDDVLIRDVDNIPTFSSVTAGSDAFQQTFSGNGSQTAFTLSQNLGTDEKAVFIWVDAGAGKGFEIMPPSSYTINGVNLTFTVAPATGTGNIDVRAPLSLVNAANAAAAAADISASAAAASAASAAASSAANLQGTSTTSVAIGIGSKSFTTQAGMAFTVGRFVLIVSAANPANYMHGQITAYSGTSLTVNVTNIGGSGTLNDWNITVSGTQGSQGAAGNITNIATQPVATITASDITIFADVSDSNNSKRTTVQGILDLIYMVGELKDIAGTTIPSKWLQCNGAAVSRTTYSDLFAVIGTTYGAGDGSTTFNVPDFRRRTAVGSGGTGTATLANTVGSIGGAETHTLTINEMPSHEHREGGNHESFGGAGGQTASTSVSGTRNSGSGTLDVVNYQTFSTGGGQAHNNMQPSLVVTKIIYAGV